MADFRLISGSKNYWEGLSTDTKPTSAPVGSRCKETDTGDEYVWNGTAWTVKAHGLASRIGAVTASPTANTLLARLKALLTDIVLAAGTNVIGKVRLVTALGDEVTDDTKDAVKTTETAPVNGTGVSVATTVLDDNPTSVTGDEVDISNYRQLGIFLELDSTLAPTQLQIFLDFKIGAVWHQYDEGFWGSFIFEPTRIAAGVLYCYTASRVPGATGARVRAVATGTDANNSFSVKATIGGVN